jgi:hypothetical protein
MTEQSGRSSVGSKPEGAGGDGPPGTAATGGPTGAIARAMLQRGFTDMLQRLKRRLESGRRTEN